MSGDWKNKYLKESRNEANKEFISWSHQDLVEYILALRSNVDELSQLVKETADNKATAQPSLTEKDYKESWSYATKIAFLLTINQKPLTSEELHILLLKLDKHYKNYNIPRNNLAVNIGRAVKSKRILKIKSPGIRSLFYVLPEWAEKSGELKSQYKELIKMF